MILADESIVLNALAYRMAHGPTFKARDFAEELYRIMRGTPGRSYGDDCLATIQAALTHFQADTPVFEQCRKAGIVSAQISKYFLEQETTQSLADAADYWRCGMLYYQRGHYRWTQDNSKRPTGARSGAIAVPYSRVIRNAYPDCGKFHRASWHGGIAA